MANYLMTFTPADGGQQIVVDTDAARTLRDVFMPYNAERRQRVPSKREYRFKVLSDGSVQWGEIKYDRQHKARVELRNFGPKWHHIAKAFAVNDDGFGKVTYRHAEPLILMLEELEHGETVNYQTKSGRGSRLVQAITHDEAIEIVTLEFKKNGCAKDVIRIW